MHKLREYIDDEIMELEEKVKKNGKLSTAEIEYGKDLAKFKTALLTNKAMEDEGYSDGYPRYREPYIMSYGRKRDSMGRYSRDDAHEAFIAELHELKEHAPDEHTKRKIEHFIDEMK